ncbi:MAG: AAA family ATPase, partial [Eubacteriales bacterium]
MSKKITSAIEKIILNTASYKRDEVIPTYINFFYGANGTGKSTIAESIGANNGLIWQNGKSAADYDVLVYDQDFINHNFQNYGNLTGVFTVCETNIEIQNQVEKKTADRTAFDEQFKTFTAAAGSKRNDIADSLNAFQISCWERSKSIRETFDEAMKGKKRTNLFAEAILAVPTAIENDLIALKKMYDIAFDTSSRAYQEFSKVGCSTAYGKLPGKNLMEKAIVSRSESSFTAFMKALHATDWVRQGHDHYVAQAEGICPFCQQKLPTGFDEDIKTCFDVQYQIDIDDIVKFQAAYTRETNAILDTLQANLQDVLATVELVEYKDKLALLKSSIEI